MQLHGATDHAAAAPTRTRPAIPWALRWLPLMALLLALALAGARPPWDPDEGRYSNVALNMLESGDWVHPMRSHEVAHWTKPPLTYWAVAASVGALGYNAFAARLPGALAFLACVWLTGRIGQRLLPGRGRVAALAFATMVLPVGAAHWISTDAVLTACTTLALWGYVEARFGTGAPRRWVWLMWAGFGLAFLTKGPPALLLLLPVLAVQWATAPERRPVLWRSAGLPFFLLLALGWFAVVAWERPALVAYFLGREVADRALGAGFDRHGGWFGWATVYLPTLVLGSVPWTGRAWRWLRGQRAVLAGLRTDRAAQAPALMVLAWIALPLLVFCLAGSRMPLYLLPLFPALALAVASRLDDRHPLLRRRWAMPLWVAVLLALQLAAASWPTHKNAGEWAEAIRARAPGPLTEVVFVDDMARYGLHLALGVNVEKVSLAGAPGGGGDAADHRFAAELDEREVGVVFVTKASHWPAVAAAATNAGFTAKPLGDPHRGRVLFTVRPMAAATTAPDPRGATPPRGPLPDAAPPGL